MKVVILCGGRGTRMERETDYRPKPMIEIGHKPILWHIMNIYSACGFNDFVLCLGYKGEVVKNYFLNYAALNSDITINTKTSKIKIHKENLPGWNVTLADTGFESMTGARIKRVERYIDSETFMLTYGDAVADIDIQKLLEFHRQSGRIATMTGVFPTYKSRFGELSADNNTVLNFTEKPVNCAALTSGGFFVLQKKVFEYLSDEKKCVFEKDVLEKLVKEKQLCLYRHDYFWYCMDTPRDLKFLNALWESGKAPWLNAGEGERAPDHDWKKVLDSAY